MKPVEPRAENRTTLPLEVAGWSPTERGWGYSSAPQRVPGLSHEGQGLRGAGSAENAAAECLRVSPAHFLACCPQLSQHSREEYSLGKAGERCLSPVAACSAHSPGRGSDGKPRQQASDFQPKHLWRPLTEFREIMWAHRSVLFSPQL